MKYINLFFVAILLCGFSNKIDRPDDFIYKLNDIASKFKREILNLEECEKLERETYSLSLDIDYSIRNESNYTQEEKGQLDKLKKEADALYKYIIGITALRSQSIEIDNFIKANERVGGQVLSIVKDKYCLDIISVTIGGCLTYLVVNNSPYRYIIHYHWKTSKGIPNGSGTIDSVPGKSLQVILNNRKDKLLKNVSFWGITCNVK